MSTIGSRARDGNALRLKRASPESFKSKMKRDKTFQTKVVIRRLPPSMTGEQFIEQISPLPDHDYMYFVKADMRLGPHAFSRAYINFLIPEEIFIFKDKFDGYVFLDSKGNEYPAVVEFAPFQKIPKKRNPKKRDAKCGTIETDPDYVKFLESLKKQNEVTLPSAEAYLEEIESREKELKANNGVPKVSTPLIEFLKARKIEQQKIRDEKREERKRKDMEKKRIREEERRKRKAEKDKERVKEKSKEKDSLSEKEVNDELEKSSVSDNAKQIEPVVQVLKNPEREKELIITTSTSTATTTTTTTTSTTTSTSTPQKSKDYFVSSRVNKDKDRNKKEWERIRPKERQKAPVRSYFNDKDRSRRDKTDYKLYNNKKQFPIESFSPKHKDTKEADPQTEKLTKSVENSKDSKVDLDSATCSQWPSKDKRDNSCPGNVETLGSQKEKNELSCKQFKNSSKSVTGDDISNMNDVSKSDSNTNDYRDREKDPRVERRIRNKDRPSIEIYRPGLRRFSAQRSSPQKEISTSASNSSSPSPTPPLTTTAIQIQVKKEEETDDKSPV
ncbi:regulator of nonsense transcripts 3A [Trichonephila inaurata madagascariensis]|uniref:Regulator of nonsense transcripts 3A n=1 Tax=Trichonephila inaurata madagascariensis TaxID=2747483 RepID=A0A8X6YP37_9ARAC|nr:regulator of nonsense transcripts 3A [Trichonephila inaurata madagascariensis]